MAAAATTITSQHLDDEAQSALRRIEAWLQREERAARPPPADDAATVFAVSDGGLAEDAMELRAYPAHGAPEGAAAATRTAAQLEALVLQAERHTARSSAGRWCL